MYNMKTVTSISCMFFFCLSFLFLPACKNEKHNPENGVIEESNKNDYYQMRGFGDSIPSDSIKKEKLKDSIRISRSPNMNK